MGLGCALVWLPYLGYVASDLDAWRAQTALYAPRFELLNPAWYASNLLHEPQRYHPGALLGAWRPGVWAALLALPLSLGALARRAWRGDRAARAIVLPALLFPLLFALLIFLKLSNYLVMQWPLWALAVAWGGVALWRRVGRARYARWARAGLLLLLLAVGAEGGARIVAMQARAASTTPYAVFIAPGPRRDSERDARAGLASLLAGHGGHRLPQLGGALRSGER